MREWALKWAQERARAWGNALLPPVCLLCGASGGHQPLCPACQNDLPALSAPCCPICLEATPYGERCGACLVHPPHFDRVFALYHYVFPVDRLIHELKYSAQFALARRWRQELATRLVTQPHRADRILPLPLHDERLAERGYNQAQEIARALSRATGIALDTQSLSKCRATRPQSESSLKERRRNLKNAFACQTDLSGQRLLLVDDVLTTGTTLNEAARVLKLHGAEEVTALVVARTPKHH
jgi:ComF family protein